MKNKDEAIMERSIRDTAITCLDKGLDLPNFFCVVWVVPDPDFSNFCVEVRDDPDFGIGSPEYATRYNCFPNNHGKHKFQIIVIPLCGGYYTYRPVFVPCVILSIDNLALGDSTA